MIIGGIGRISRQEVMKALTVDERRAIREGEYPITEAARYYKILKTQEASRTNDVKDFFAARSMLSDKLLDDLTPGQLAEIIDIIDELAQIINGQANTINELRSKKRGRKVYKRED